MDKKTLKNYLKKRFQNLIEWDETTNFSAEAAIYYFAANWHSGQASDLYSILSLSQYNPGSLETFDNWKKNDEIGSMFYDALETFLPTN